ncbi:MAG: hypothetical protein AAFO81_03655 [Pseudomonadota bacterium]
MNSQFENNRNFLALLVLLAIAASGATALAQEPQEIRYLALELEPSKRTYALGEPVYVTVRLRNRGTSKQSVATMLDPAAGFLSIFVKPAGAQQQQLFIPLAVGDFDVAPSELAASGEMNATFPIFFGGNGWTFTQTGDYDVFATLAGSGSAALRSTTAPITIARGDGAGQYLFSQSRQDQYETGKFLVWQQGDHLRRAHATLDEIIKQFPDAPLSNHAVLATGVSLSRPFHDYSIGRVRAAQPERALELLNRVNINELPDLLRLHRSLALARAYAAAGLRDDAQVRLDDAQSLAADSVRALQQTLTAELTYDPVLAQMNKQ